MVEFKAWAVQALDGKLASNDLFAKVTLFEGRQRAREYAQDKPGRNKVVRVKATIEILKGAKG
jgi:hypothetical protein